MTAPARTALKAARHLPSGRHLSIFSPAKAHVQPVTQPATEHISVADFPPPALKPESPNGSSRTYFDGTDVLWVGLGGDKPPDPNKAKLGKTLRILQDRLPTLLQYPLPQEILAPNICLHLFPSTHPHLPTVSGRVAYSAALWTSPIAWNRVPLVYNVKLEILAERMTSEPLTFLPRRPGALPEQLVVRWCEKRKPEGPPGAQPKAGLAASLGIGRGVDPKKAFTGLFIFDFDKEGRVLTHTIEQAQSGSNWEKGMGAKFVGLTDWLLGGIKGPGDTVPAFQRLDKKRRHE